MFPDRVVADGRCEEIGWDKSCTLMDKLVERMLPVCSRLAPDYRPGLISHRPSRSIDRLAIAFHVALLEISGKAVHVLVIRQYYFGLSAEKISVPDAD